SCRVSGVQSCALPIFGTICCVANVKMSPICMLAPPVRQHLIWGSGVPKREIDLGIDVIHPPFLEPFQRVCVQLAVPAETCGGRSARMVLFIVPDSEWA